MNIIVIGSCKDSSYLAKELNKRLSNSIVARIDLLKDIKQLILPTMEVETSENIGTYIGDVEGYDISKVDASKREDIKKLFNTIYESLKKSSKKEPLTTHQSNTFDLLTNGIPSGTYSFVKIYSGVINNFLLENLHYTESIVINIKEPDTPITKIELSEELLNNVKENAFAYIECTKASEVLKSDILNLALGNGEKPTKKGKQKEVTIINTFETAGDFLVEDVPIAA